VGERQRDATGLLRACAQGDLAARDELLPLVYDELRRRAAAYLRRERVDHTLQPTALVHEAFLRLVPQDQTAWQNRAQFVSVAAQMMRRVLVDHARARRRGKRLGYAVKVTLTDHAAAVAPPDCDVLLLDQALDELGAIDPRQVRIVELRYFGGLSEDEIAAALVVSRSTVARDWQIARGWLYRRMTAGSANKVP
jgi:RNA polymerase sigma-70 factor (ECF subfamily)